MNGLDECMRGVEASRVGRKGKEYRYLSYVVVILCLDGGVGAQTRCQEPQQQDRRHRHRRRDHGGFTWIKRTQDYETRDMAETEDP